MLSLDQNSPPEYVCMQFGLFINFVCHNFLMLFSKADNLFCVYLFNSDILHLEEAVANYVHKCSYSKITVLNVCCCGEFAYLDIFLSTVVTESISQKQESICITPQRIWGQGPFGPQMLSLSSMRQPQPFKVHD